MEPIPETVEAVNELEPAADADELLAGLVRLASLAQEVVPDLVGVSIARLDEGLSFTLVATAQEIAVLDAVQYLAGGPCVEAAEADEIREFDREEVLSEERWSLFAEATAAHVVRSTLTLPVMSADRVTGTVNLYAASRRAFVGHHEELGEIFGAWAAGAVADADLPFNTRREAMTTVQRLREQAVVDVAIGVLAADLAVDVEAAQQHLEQAAARAGVSAVDLARAIVEARRKRDQGAE